MCTAWGAGGGGGCGKWPEEDGVGRDMPRPAMCRMWGVGEIRAMWCWVWVEGRQMLGAGGLWGTAVAQGVLRFRSGLASAASAWSRGEGAPKKKKNV